MIIRRFDGDSKLDTTAVAGGWQSRGLILARDGKPYSLHDTTLSAGSKILVDYPHHLETAYCIEGSGALENLNSKTRFSITPGTVYSPESRHRIRLRAHTDLRLICVITPPLAGGERLDKSGAFPLAPGTHPVLRKKNIFVMGLNEFNMSHLSGIRNAENYNFLKLMDFSEIRETRHIDMDAFLGRARSQLEAWPGMVDGLIHYLDFPASTTAPILCSEFGLPSASLEAVLKCEHKYWSRLEQKRSIPDHIPEFAVFDPFDDSALDSLALDFPFWVKPIKSFSSYLGFLVQDRADWDRARARIRAQIGRIEKPFNRVLELADLPDEIVGVGGGYCIAESIIGGRMCTQEGYVHNGRMHVYGTVDSLREVNSSSFSSYQYPSRLPASVRERMANIADRFLTHIEYDNAPFNVEFFWDPETDHIWLLEVNTRISESHTDLFLKVDGASHHEVATDLSLGERPRMPYRDGEFTCAGKFFIRAHHDAVVTRVPDANDLARLERLMPGTIVKIVPEPGQQLSSLLGQDSYSYVLAELWIGASSPKKLEQRYEKAVEILSFELKSPL